MKKEEESKFEIEKGVPLKKNHTTYPFDKMEIGDSFYIPIGDHRKIQSVHTMICTASRMYCLTEKQDKKFTTVKDENGVRVWRIK